MNDGGGQWLAVACGQAAARPATRLDCVGSISPVYEYGPAVSVYRPGGLPIYAVYLLRERTGLGWCPIGSCTRESVGPPAVGYPVNVTRRAVMVLSFLAFLGS